MRSPVAIFVREHIPKAIYDFLKWTFTEWIVPATNIVVAALIAYLREASWMEKFLVGAAVMLVLSISCYLVKRFIFPDETPKRAAGNTKRLKFSTGTMEGRASTISSSYGKICLWYRLEVTTDHPGGIKGCKGQLLRIKKGDRIMFDKEEALLTFAPGEQPDAIAKHIYPKAVFNLDVLYISDQNEIYIAVYGRKWRYLPTSDLFPEPGDYILDILVIGEDMEPEVLTVLFKWNGFWTTSGLYLVR